VYHPAGIATRDVATTSSSGRTDIWRVGLAACPHYCVFGSGWETFPDVYAATQASVPDAAVLVGGGNYQPHNVWLLVAIELGLPGLVLLASVLIVTFYEALRLPTALRGPPMSGFIATIVAALFLSNLEYKFFWMALILVALSRNVALVESRPAAGRSGTSQQTYGPGSGQGPVSVPAGV
jgi:O-antigen ligase